MKATGIVRRIDDLGRIVIPKEIRRTLRIREGDPLEIFTEREGNIVLKKYSPIGELGEYARDFSFAIEGATDKTSVICDCDSVIAASGPHKKDYLSRPLSSQIGVALENRSALIRHSDAGGCIPVCEGEDARDIFSQVIVPILSAGQIIGAVVILDKSRSGRLGEPERAAAQVAAAFLGTQMEQ